MSTFDEYAARLAARAAQADRLERTHSQLASVRLLLFAATAVAAWAAWYLQVFSAWWLLAPAAAFAVLVAYHARIRRARRSAQRAAQFYSRGVARIQDRWVGGGQSGERFADLHHFYAADLDLFGKGSLFELLSVARTRMGEDELARWLKAPADVETIRRRQECVADLRNKLDLREELAVLGEETVVGVQPEALLQWAEAPNRLRQPWLPWVAAFLAVLAIGGAIWWGVTGLATPFFGILLIEGGVLYALRKPLQEVLGATEQAFENLRLLAELLARFEREPYSAPPLRHLVLELAAHNRSAAQAIGRLSTIVQFIESRRNEIVRALEVPLLYSVQAALAAERWRTAHGRSVRVWCKAIGELEALVCLATYSHEHPDDPLPEFVEGRAAFVGESLGHPLLPAAACVRNDVSIRDQARVLLISGSNMSGKSTLLRTIGINTVLAMMGAPVRARRLQLTPLQVGASIRINDSLHEGSSRFYAEITRLRQLYDLCQRELPLLFLLDELLQGTNSNDRRIGAQGIVQAFLKRGAIGLISTHDLALTDVGGGALRNLHFQDEIENGAMKFDFKLREGVVTKSNGIELMRSIGLDV